MCTYPPFIYKHPLLGIHCSRLNFWDLSRAFEGNLLLTVSQSIASLSPIPVVYSIVLIPYRKSSSFEVTNINMMHLGNFPNHGFMETSMHYRLYKVIACRGIKYKRYLSHNRNFKLAMSAIYFQSMVSVFLFCLVRRHERKKERC